jgi:hypothetical protein
LLFHLPTVEGNKEVQQGSYMEEDKEHCLKCGKQEGLQGITVSIGELFAMFGR